MALRGMRCIAAVLLACIGQAQAATPDCDGDAMRVLRPVVHAASDARAYWLDDTLVRWPGQPADARYRLVVSSNAALRVERGKPVEGAGQSFALSAANGVPDGVERRFAFTGDGATLLIPETARRSLRDLLRTQVMLVREDAQGNVVDATYLQTPGALDVLYRAAEAMPLGADVLDGETAFAIWAPTAVAVAVCLSDDGHRKAREQIPLDVQQGNGTWVGFLPNDLRGGYYAYLVDVFVPGTGIVRNRVTDPYSTSLTTDSARSYIADLDDPALKPAGWDEAPRPPALAS